MFVQLLTELLGRNDPTHCNLTQSLPTPLYWFWVSHLTWISACLMSPWRVRWGSGKGKMAFCTNKAGLKCTLWSNCKLIEWFTEQSTAGVLHSSFTLTEWTSTLDEAEQSFFVEFWTKLYLVCFCWVGWFSLLFIFPLFSWNFLYFSLWMLSISYFWLLSSEKSLASSSLY